MSRYSQVIEYTDRFEARKVPVKWGVAGISFNEFMRGFK